MKKGNSKSSTITDFGKKNSLEKLKDSNLYDDALFEKLAKMPVPQEKGSTGFGTGRRSEFTIFTHQTYKENELIPREIQQLKEEIRQEIEAIKQSNKTLIHEAEEIEKATIETLPQNAGIYHVRFLEVLLSLLRDLRSKVGEAKTWLSAMQTKKKKRGSLFAARAKSKGTQYSMSQELQNTRSIQ